MAALRAKLSAGLLPTDKECLLRCAAGALAIYNASVARASKNNSFASVLQDASSPADAWLIRGVTPGTGRVTAAARRIDATKDELCR